MLFAATVLVVAGWWYGRNLVLYGDPFGLTMYKGEFASQTFSPWRWADWSAGLRALGASLVARFGWMNVVAPVWVYWLAAGIGVAAIIGWLYPRRTRTNTKASAYPIPDPRSPIPKTSFLLPTLLLLALGWTFLFAVLSGQVGWQGRFVLPAAPVLAIGLAVGLGRLVRRDLALWLALVLMLGVTLALPTTAIRPAYPRLVVAAQPERPSLVRWVPDLTPPIELRGLALPPTAQVGQTLRVGTLWQALGPQDRPWTLFVHLAKPGDRYETFAVNVQPQNGAWPATRWTDGDWWEDSTMLDLPNDLPPGVYDVRMGWFDERDGQRVGVRTAAGELTGDYATVGEIEVLP